MSVNVRELLGQIVNSAPIRMLFTGYEDKLLPPPPPPRSKIEVQIDPELFERNLDHHSQRLADLSIRLAVFSADPLLSVNPANVARLTALQTLVQKHARELVNMGVRPEAPQQIVESGINAVNAIGQATTAMIINRLKPDTVINLLAAGHTPQTIAHEGIRQIVEDNAPEIIRNFIAEAQRQQNPTRG